MTTTTEQMLIEQRVANDAKSAGVAYILLFIFGGLGAHRFYLGYTGTAVTQLMLSLTGWLTVAQTIGLLPLAVLGIWLISDLILIPGMVQAQKNRRRDWLTQELRLRPKESPSLERN